jgi:hypothetical protein
MFAIIFGKTALQYREARPWMIFFILFIPFTLGSLPLFLEWGNKRREDHTAERAQWREEYRKSPEANLIRLR